MVFMLMYCPFASASDISPTSILLGRRTPAAPRCGRRFRMEAREGMEEDPQTRSGPTEPRTRAPCSFLVEVGCLLQFGLLLDELSISVLSSVRASERARERERERESLCDAGARAVAEQGEVDEEQLGNKTERWDPRRWDPRASSSVNQNQNVK